MSTPISTQPIKRLVGLTNCPAGFNDLRPVNVEPRARWWEVYEDFSAQSFRPYPPVGSDCPAWSAAYRAKDNTGQEREFSDLMVIDLHGCSAELAFKWVVMHNLAGLVHPTRSNSPASLRSRIMFVLDRPVVDRTYRLLWEMLTKKGLMRLANPAHADFRQRYDQPHAVRGQSTLLRHDGNLLNVDGVLAEPSLDDLALKFVCEAYASEGWPESMPPRNR
jgi:hypothetical protein